MNSFPDILLWFSGGLILITTMIVIILDIAFGIFHKSVKRNRHVTRIICTLEPEKKIIPSHRTNTGITNKDRLTFPDDYLPITKSIALYRGKDYIRF